MNQYKLFKHKGFSAIELLLVFGIISFILWYASHLIIERNQRENHQALADQTHEYADIAINYIQNNSPQIYKTIPQIISWHEIVTNGYVPASVNLYNLYQQEPCVLIDYNKIAGLYVLLFYVKPAATKRVIFNLMDVGETISMIGANSGYINPQGDVLGTNHSWGIKRVKSSINSNLCEQGATIPDYSIAMNLTLSQGFTVNTGDTNKALYRLKDNTTSAPLGSGGNLNTLTTDTSFDQTTQNGESYHGIVFDESTQLKITANPNDESGIDVQNGNFAARTLTPSSGNSNLQIQDLDLGTPCDASKKGAMASQSDRTGVGSLVANQLQCQYNPILCTRTSNTGYCFLPITGNQLQYEPNFYDVQCPAGYFIVEGSVTFGGNHCFCGSGKEVDASVYADYSKYTYVYQGYQIKYGVVGRCGCNMGNGKVLPGLINVSGMTCSNTLSISYSK